MLSYQNHFQTLVGQVPRRNDNYRSVGGTLGMRAQNANAMVGACPTSLVPDPWYAAWCQYNGANYEHAAKAAIAAKQPQIGLGLRNNSVAALTPGINVTATPSVPLCITDFEVSRVSSPFFLITALRAARTDFLADGVGIPADAFSPDSDHPPLEMPYLMPGTNVTVTVENIAADPHPFFATFWGIPGGHPGPCL